MIEKKNFLIIDDDRACHFLSERIILSMGNANRIYKAFNGLEALLLLQDHCKDAGVKPDIILLDLHMPVMNGFQFMEALKYVTCIERAHLQIVLLTSSVDYADERRARILGIDHYLSKPFSLVKLKDILLTSP